MPIHRDIYREGKLADLDRVAPTPDERERAINMVRARSREEYFRGQIETCVEEIAPSIVLVDVIASQMSFVAHRLGLPCIQLSTSLSQRVDELPPLTALVRPNAAPELMANARRVALTSFPASVHDLNLLKARFGYPSAGVSFASVFTPSLTLYPEFVLCPSAFDFARTRGEAPTYLAFSPDIDRDEEVPESLGAFVDPQRRLLYASLGSQSGRYPDASRFFESFLAAMRARPDWHAVLVVGPHFERASCADPPENLLVLRSAPQLWLLRRADVFLTHAGLGGVREAIALGVPMVAVPQAYDQPGNAARVAHHGLGVAMPRWNVTPTSLTGAVEHLIADLPNYRARLRALDLACRAEAESTCALEPLERIERSARTGDAKAPVIGQRVAQIDELPARRGWLFVDRAGTLPSGERLDLDPTRVRAVSDGAELGVGAGGFTICESLSDALSRAEGSWLARVEASGGQIRDGQFVVGRTLRCLWIVDMTEALLEFAEWCSGVVFDANIPMSPDDVSHFKESLRVSRELRAAGNAADFLHAFHRQTSMRAYGADPARGFVVVASATAPDAHNAARLARWQLIEFLSLAAVGGQAGTREGADLYVDAQRSAFARVDAELEDRLIARARAAGLTLDG